MSARHMTLVAVGGVAVAGTLLGGRHVSPSDGPLLDHGPIVIGGRPEATAPRTPSVPAGVGREDRERPLPLAATRTANHVADVLLANDVGQRRRDDRAALATLASPPVARLLSTPPRPLPGAPTRPARRGRIEALAVTKNRAVIAVAIRRRSSAGALILTLERRGRRWRVTEIG